MRVSKARILFVDDDLSVLQGFRRTLHAMRQEWEMCFATDGNAALELLSQHPVDVVVTDLLMPGKEGIETIRELRRVLPSHDTQP